MADTIELGAVERLVGDAAAMGLDVLDQIVDRPSSGRCRRDGSGLLGSCHPRQCRAADAQPGQSGSRDQIDLVPKVARKRKIDVALSNSFGFGGTNASLVLKRFENQ
jgi:3-oxoacyl-[acyl-carrier-protein] synthase II